MKKLLITVPALILLIGTLLSTGACGMLFRMNEAVQDIGNQLESELLEEMENAMTAPPLGYRTFNNGTLSFAYPEGWTATTPASGLTRLSSPSENGANITLSSEPYSDDYKEMTQASFDETLRPHLEENGLTLTNVTIAQRENLIGTPITQIAYDASYGDTQIKQTMFVVAAGLLNYCVSITEMSDDDGALSRIVFDSLAVQQ